MNEGGFWEYIKPVLERARLDPHRVENKVGEGTPDVNYSRGWIETKYLPAWPKRVSSKVRLPRYTGPQSVWLWRRWACGGLSWLLIRAGSDMLLVPGADALDVRNGLTRAQLAARAAWAARVPMNSATRDALGAALGADVERMPRDHRAARLARLLSRVDAAGVAACYMPEEWDAARVEAAERGEPRHPADVSDLLEHWLA